jgi:hypothetical protein
MAQLERACDFADFKADAAAQTTSLDHANLLCRRAPAPFLSLETSTLHFS